MADVTQILAAIEQGDPHAAADLLPLVYDELRKLAAARMAAEAPGHTLQPTALVHEAYLRLVGGEQPEGWNGRAHFFGAAAEAMRRLLVDHVRRKHGLRRGGSRGRRPLSTRTWSPSRRPTSWWTWTTPCRSSGRPTRRPPTSSPCGCSAG